MGQKRGNRTLTSKLSFTSDFYSTKRKEVLNAKIKATYQFYFHEI